MSFEETIFKNLLEDQLLYDKGYLKKEDLDDIKLFKKQKNKLLEIIRLMVINHKEGEFTIKKVINNSFRD